jgi:L-alanine-DL-glutamate epimerase-like enolase superfamily enzyme
MPRLATGKRPSPSLVGDARPPWSRNCAETPVLPEATPGLIQGSALPIPVALRNTYTRLDFRDLIERGAARYLMPDVCRANGFSETLKLARLAAAHQVAVSPHVVHELSLQVSGALSNGFLVEWIDWVPEDPFEQMPIMHAGDFLIPDRPGHGVALTPRAERRYRVS